MIGSLK